MGNLFLIEFLRAIYPVWGMTGILVSFNYGRNAREAWIVNGGRWSAVPAEWASIPWFVIHGCTADVWHLLRHRSLPVAPPSFAGLGYSPGHLLRFFIMMSFISSAIFGFLLIAVDRTHWSLELLLATSTAVTTSATAGFGHLFIAWRMQPRRWRWTVMAAIIFVPLAMTIDHWVW